MYIYNILIRRYFFIEKRVEKPPANLIFRKFIPKLSYIGRRLTKAGSPHSPLLQTSALLYGRVS